MDLTIGSGLLFSLAQRLAAAMRPLIFCCHLRVAQVLSIACQRGEPRRRRKSSIRLVTGFSIAGIGVTLGK
jgi:hypothetical protein